MRSLSSRRSAAPSAARPFRRHRRVHRTRAGLALARWRRSSLGALALALSAAGVAGVLTLQLLTSASDARDRWGDVVEVAVLVDDIAAGEVVDAAKLEIDMRPRHLVPASALALDEAVGRVAIAALVRGEPVVEARVSDDLVPAGWRAIAIPAPAGGAHPDVMAGDAVEILDVGAADALTASEGIVVSVRDADGLVTVAVPREAAGAVAYAAVAGSAVIALTAAPPPR